MLYVNGISLSVYHLNSVACVQDDLHKKQKELADLEKRLKSDGQGKKEDVNKPQESTTAVVSWICTTEFMSGGGGQELLQQPARAIEAYDLQVRGRACDKIS